MLVEVEPKRRTAEQWVDVFLAASREERLRLASVALSMSEELDAGRSCWMGNHVERITRYEQIRGELSKAAAELTEAAKEMSEDAQPGVLAVIARFERAARLS